MRSNGGSGEASDNSDARTAANRLKGEEGERGSSGERCDDGATVDTAHERRRLEGAKEERRRAVKLGSEGSGAEGEEREWREGSNAWALNA